MATVTIGGLPVYQACVTDEDTGMFRISLVDDPAVQSFFQAFDAQHRMRMYAVSDEERRLVLGVVMRADFPIYRRDDQAGEYYVIYKPEEIRKMAEKYLLEGRQNDVNLMHREGTDTDGVQMVQYFIKGKGINPDGFDEISDGSLFAEFHIVNDDVWAAVKDGTYKGFSLEGVFDMVPETDKARVEEIVDDLDGKFSSNHQSQHIMSKLQKIRAGLTRLLAQFGNVTTDRGILAWDGDDDLKAGDRVYIEDQDGNRTDPEDGDYRTEDGKTIVVENNQVAEIRDPEAEVAPEVEDEGREDVNARRASHFARLRQIFEESYEDKIRKIWDAIAARYRDGYVVETADDYAVAEIWDEDYNHRYIRFAITWDQDGDVTLGEEQEVKQIFVPLDFVSPFETGAAGTESEELRRENVDLRAQLAELKARPAAKPAHVEVKGAADIRKTGVKGLDRIAAMMQK
ncbi:MAG: hypothetical protein IJ654_05345 [Bacteroidales bacterium]|nr:hypothetical protein [Bacteroidales bacterium]